MERIGDLLSNNSSLASVRSSEVRDSESNSNSLNRSDNNSQSLHDDNLNVSSSFFSESNLTTPFTSKQSSNDSTLFSSVDLKTNIASSSSNNSDSNNGENPAHAIWKYVTEFIKPNVDEQIYNAWFRPLSLKSISFSDKEGRKEGKALVLVPNKFSRDHIKTNYTEILETVLSESAGYKISVQFELSLSLPFSSKNSSNPPPINNREFNNKDKREINLNQPESALSNQRAEDSLSQSYSNRSSVSVQNPISSASSPLILKSRSNSSRAISAQDQSAIINANLNVNYNFSNFVIGNCNQFAHAACLKVAESPGTSYNPLLIYGGVGLGKTHLANAVGNAASRRKKKVLLASSETFVSELITSLKTNSMDRFKNKFRSLDILIIDDIQFIIGKERTQEEFFHTFNELYGKQKQIIITSDKLPQDLIGLEERLRTRFASGLSVDLQPPDFETRVAILVKKAESSGVEIPSDVARIIANRIDTNVRELEGALTRLQALCSLLGEKPSIEIAQKVIDTIAPSKNKELTTDAIKQAVARQFNVSINDLTGKRRTQNIALARQVAMFLCRKHTARSFPEIGALFGGRDHSTVIHAIKCVNEKVNADEILREQIERVLGILNCKS